MKTYDIRFILVLYKNYMQSCLVTKSGTLINMVIKAPINLHIYSTKVNTHQCINLVQEHQLVKSGLVPKKIIIRALMCNENNKQQLSV